MKRRDLEKVLRELGWRLCRHGGKHDVWINGEHELVIPRQREINEYTARAIIEKAKGYKR